MPATIRDGTDKQISLQIRNGDGRVKISVIDNGIGIPAENLTRIFNHGFTTRKDGHGFGLHRGRMPRRNWGETCWFRAKESAAELLLHLSCRPNNQNQIHEPQSRSKPANPGH